MGAVTLVALAFAAPWRSHEPPPDAELLSFRSAKDGQGTFATVPIRFAGWQATKPIDDNAGAPLVVGVGERYWGEMAVAPDGKRIAITWLLPDDSGLTEIFLREPDGTMRRLTNSPGDDVEPSWSPDGRSLVFSTTRWSPRGDANFDIGVLDIATGEARQLTRGPDRDGLPRWSPDGTRIGFLRARDAGGQALLCWVTADGRREECRGGGGTRLQQFVGWYGPNRVVTIEDSMGTEIPTLRVRDPDGPGNSLLDSTWTNLAGISADGRWIVGRGRVGREHSLTYRVFPTEQPGLSRSIGPPSDLESPIWRTRASPPYLDTLRIAPNVAAPVVGVAHTLLLKAVGHDGNPIELPTAVLLWHVSDPRIATIDSISGVLMPLRVGSVQVFVDAGGWRSDSTVLHVGAATSAIIDSIRWTEAEWKNWIRFGTPESRVEATPSGGFVMLPNGNGTFESGVVSARRYGVKGGLGVEALVSLPIDQPKWQRLKLELGTHVVVGRDEAYGQAACAINFPSGEGRDHFDKVGAGDFTTPGFARLRDGAWHRFRIDVLPDGSCRYGVDGQFLGASALHFEASDSVQIIFTGQSEGVRIAVGAVEVWRGVKR